MSIKTVIAHNYNLLFKSGLTVTASIMAQIQEIGAIFQALSAVVAVVVGILTTIKLWKDIKRK